MPKFNINNYQGNYAMHCQTRQEAEKFCRYLHNTGRKWCDGSSYLTQTSWDTYGSNTTYDFNNGRYAGIDYFDRNDYNVLEFSDFEFENTKQVIYKKNGVYYVTTEENYNLHIVDIRLTHKMEDFNSPEEIINYYCTYCSCNKEDFIVIDESQEEKIMENKNIITEEERQYLLASMKKLLSEYDYPYETFALDDIIDEWSIQKATLINAFKTHQNYVEGKFMIAFNTDYTREIDNDGVTSFINWIRDLIPNRKDLRNPEIVAKANEEQCICLPDKIYEFLWYSPVIHCFSTRILTEEYAEKIKNIFEGIHVHAGEKSTKVMNKICKYIGYDKHEDYNRRYAKFADALSPIVIKRHTILSLNPLDYLTMSFGNSWASCHTIDKGNKRQMPNNYSGCYSSGTMSYMLDPSSMVLYVVDAKYDGDEYWTQPKIVRQMFHYGEDKLIQARLYPQDNDGNGDVYKPYRELVQEIIATIFNFPNLWITKGCDVICDYTMSYGTHYRDYENFSSCRISKIKDRDNESRIIIGASPICIECGERHSVEDNINCCTGKREYCYDCGCLIDEDEGIWVDGEIYCRDCVSYCDYCNEYHRSDSTYIESDRISVCDWCLSEHYAWCDNCDEYHRIDNSTYVESLGRYVCDDCLDEYIKCEFCGEYFEEDEITVNGNEENVCNDCLKERHIQCMDCEKWYPEEEIEDGLCEHCQEAREENEEEC